MDETEARTLLQDLAADDGPPSAVDLDRAVSDGRRRRRVNVAAGGLAVTAVVGAVTAMVALFAVPTGRPAPPVGGGSATAPAASPDAPAGTAPAEAPQQFDPMVQYARLGWVPEWCADRSTTLQPTSLRTGCTSAVRGGEAPESVVGLSVFSRGVAVNVYGGVNRKERLSPAEPVNGRPAWWVTEESAGTGGGPARATLRWEYAEGGLAEVGIQPPAGTDARALAVRMAGETRFGVNEPMRLPSVPGNVPDTLRLQRVDVAYYQVGIPEHWQWSLKYVGRDTPPGDEQRTRLLTVSGRATDRRTGDGRKIESPNTTFDGHPANRQAEQGGESLTVFDVQGMYLAVSVADTSVVGTAEAVFRGLTLNPDERTWSR